MALAVTADKKNKTHVGNRMSAHRTQRHWSQINEVGFVAGMRFLFVVYRLLGRWPFRIALYPVLIWYVLFTPAARKASSAYLDKVHALNPTVKTGLPGVFRHFFSFAENILDKLLLWGGEFHPGHIERTGHEHILANIDRGRGGLLICSHLGNLELCRVLSRQRHTLKLTVLVHTKHAKAFNRMLAKLDPDSAMNLLQVTEMSPAVIMMMAERIARGEFIAIAGDRVPVSTQPRVAYAPFLGQQAAFPIGPYVLASLLQCPSYLVFSLKTDTAVSLHIEPFKDSIHLPRKDREAYLTALTADYACRLEHHCLRAPLQWFNFYDFWATPAPIGKHVEHD